VSDTIKVTNRETYSLLEYFGDIGGLYEFLYLFIGFFLTSFPKTNLKAIVANKLYSWTTSAKNTQKPIPIIRHLEIKLAFQRFILCCCRQQWFRKYEKSLDKVE